MTDNKRQELLKQLDTLKQFPNFREVIALRKRIKENLKRVSKKVNKKQKSTDNPNQSRSSKMSKYWRYIKMIRNNFPDLSISEIRVQFSKRKRGSKVNIPDAIWQNPSP